MYSVAQLADLLSVSPKSVYRLLKNGLEHYRFGNAIRVDDRQLKMFLDSQKCKEDGNQLLPPSGKRSAKLKHLKL